MSDRNRRLWMTAGAAALAGLVAGAVPVPGGLDPGSGAVTRLFAAVASIAIVLLAILPGVVIRAITGRRSIWIGAAVVSLVLGAGAYVAHSVMERTCTARYDGRVTMIGTAWTALGESYAKGNPGLTNDDLLFDATGVAERLWTRESIDACRVRIRATYFLWLPCLAACLVALLQAVPSGTLPAGMRAQVPASVASASTLRYDVFISYRHGGRDGDFAGELLVALERAGYLVAIDERDFPANASFLQEMERCIRESRFTVSIISPRYLDSGNCEEEAILCKVLDMNDRRRRLIPMVIESVAMPAWLFGIVGIDCTKPDPLVDPFDKLRSTLGSPLMPAKGSTNHSLGRA